MSTSTLNLLWLQSLACAECHHSLIIEPKAVQRLPEAIPPFLHSTPHPLNENVTTELSLYDVQDVCSALAICHWPAGKGAAQQGQRWVTSKRSAMQSHSPG